MSKEQAAGLHFIKPRLPFFTANNGEHHNRKNSGFYLCQCDFVTEQSHLILHTMLRLDSTIKATMDGRWNLWIHFPVQE